ncbi:MAG: hypothetical protein GY913_14670 [Proteobacteria bacterium]|nr:hypothetical protein [Pseudomonadota bacterium]MCP4918154.1 hypothetical protein [Pseudomonadota bacterium]
MLDHPRIRRAARLSGIRHFEEWTRDPRDYLVCRHRLELRHHRVWELGPAYGPPVGLVVTESLLTGVLRVTSEDPAATNRVLACEAIAFGDLPVVCFELLRTIGAGERHLLGLDAVTRRDRTMRVRFAVESTSYGITQWTCEFGPHGSRRRIEPIVTSGAWAAEAC